MKLFRTLYFRVLLATFFGIGFGLIDPARATSCKILGDSFVDLIKMIIGPVIFCTIALGMSGGQERKAIGRIAGKTLIYFELVSTLALLIGLGLANLLGPGKNFHLKVADLDPSLVKSYVEKGQGSHAIDLLHRIIPKTFMDAFSGNGDLLQILLLSIFFGLALSAVGEKGRIVRDFLEGLSQVFFKIVHLLMQFAPIGAFGAMAFTIGAYGLRSFGPLLSLMAVFYLSCLVFIVCILGLIAYGNGYNIFRLIFFLKDELLLVLGTSSSESALPPLMEKMESLGCKRSTVGFVIPAGYSFNLDGTNIYLTLAIVFLAQALDIPLSLREQLSILLVAVVSSKGASGVTGAGFITLAATLVAVPGIPAASLAILLGIDRFMSEARALTNIIGNGVATIAISRWEKEIDASQLRERLK